MPSALFAGAVLQVIQCLVTYQIPVDYDVLQVAVWVPSWRKLGRWCNIGWIVPGGILQ